MIFSPIGNILRAATTAREKLNIVSFLFDGEFESTLIDTGHNIYGSPASLVVHNRPIDGRLKIIPAELANAHRHIVFDLVIFNHNEQAAKASLVSKLLHIPILQIKHLVGSASISGIESVSVHNFSTNSEIIPYGVKDRYEACLRDTDVLVYGNFVPSDYRVVKFLKQLHFKVKVFGNNPGISTDISQDQLASELLRSKIFINLSSTNVIPKHSLLAMMCGCAIISNSGELPKSLFSSEFSELVSSIEDFAPTINRLLEGEYEIMGQKAREFAKEKHDYEKIVSLWKNKLETKSKEVYVR